MLVGVTVFVGTGVSKGQLPLSVTKPPEVIGVSQEQTIKVVYADKLNCGNETLVNGLVTLSTVIVLFVLFVMVYRLPMQVVGVGLPSQPPILSILLFELVRTVIVSALVEKVTDKLFIGEPSK